MFVLGVFGCVFSLLLPGCLAARLFIVRATAWECIFLGSLIGIFSMPFFFFGIAMLLGSTISWPIVLGTSLVVNLSLGLGILSRRGRREEDP